MPEADTWKGNCYTMQNTRIPRRMPNLLNEVGRNGGGGKELEEESQRRRERSSVRKMAWRDPELNL